MLEAHPAERIHHFEIPEGELIRQWDELTNRWVYIVTMSLEASLRLPHGFHVRAIRMKVPH